MLPHQRIVAPAVIVLWLFVLANWSSHVSAEERLVILHSSEHHGALLPFKSDKQTLVGGVIGRASIINRTRKASPSTLVVDSGDVLIGTTMSSVFRGEADIQAMNLMGYQAIAVGNHDLDYGIEHLSRLQAWARFPILCSNRKGREQALPCAPSTFVRLGKLTVGLMGLLGRSTFPGYLNPKVVPDLHFQDPIEAARALAGAWKTERAADLVVAITHQTTEEDLELLAQGTGVDIIIGGHSDGFEGMITQGESKPVDRAATPGAVFVKTHRHGATLGLLELVMEGGQITEARAENIPVEAIANGQNPLTELINTYEQKLRERGSEPIGRTTVELDGSYPQIRLRETNLGDLLADLAPHRFGTDIALLNSGQIRGSLGVGTVTYGQLLQLLPFDSKMMTLKLTGRELLRVLEHSVSLLPLPIGRFLQVSGISVTYDLGKPSGNRVHRVTVNGQPLVLDRIYSVATDEFIANGGDDYVMFAHATDRIDRQIPLRDLLLDEIRRRPLEARVEGRIAYIEASQGHSHEGFSKR